MLFTGKGGVGKTTVAAATGVHAARAGRKVLVVSTDAAHSLADALGSPGSAEPVEVDTGLYVAQVDAQRRLEQSWGQIQHFLITLLDGAGVDALAAEELTVLPGAEEVLALLEVRAQVASGRFDAVVVDCAPTGETLRLLALPDVLGWYVDRLLPRERRVVAAMRPVLSRAAGVPVLPAHLVDAADRLRRDLADVRNMLTDPASSSVRLVLTPEEVVVAEARRALTSLSLYGYRVDGVVANRVFPAGGADRWRAGWVRAQAARLADVESSFAPLPVWRAPYRPSEPIGIPALAELAAQLYGSADPLAPPAVPDPVRVERDGEEFLLVLALPFADRRDVDLLRRGDELVVTVGSFRRVMALPSALQRCDVVGARFADRALSVRFRPDPALWMRT